MKIWNWIKSLFSHPKTTTAGLVQSAAGIALAAAMALGKAPATAETISLAGGLVAGGLGNISAKDASTSKAIQVVQETAQVAASGAQIADLVQATIETEAQKAKDARASTLTSAIAEMLQSQITPPPDGPK